MVKVVPQGNSGTGMGGITLFLMVSVHSAGS